MSFTHATPPRLILASTSAYRRELLSRLRWPFDAHSPGVDETPLPGETPIALAERLALAKARAVAGQFPDALVIGSDQVADLNGQSLGKPGHRTAARAQLRAMSGQVLVFQTAVCVVCLRRGFEQRERVPVTVRMRELTDAEIDHYLQLEPAFDCAGSAKSEALGIALMASLSSDDPTALVGLPLIATTRLLREAGFVAP